MSDPLADIAEAIRRDLNERNAARDRALTQSRELIRHCAECIRAIHRHEWESASARLEAIDRDAEAMRATTAPYPDLAHAGYTQDALKERVEAHLTYAMVRALPLPTPQALQVESATYLNGLAEAASELRRFILDIMRREEAHSDEAERLLAWMDAVYDHLITFDFPDAITGGLRRATDVLRGVLERTRGDLTTSLRQQQLQDALSRLEQRLG
jgi:translin